MNSVGRNSPCTCGSGKKYKKCCYGKSVLTQNMATQTGNQTRVLTASQRLSNAVTLHQAGQFDDAKDIYQALLQDYPDSSDTMHYLHYLGMIEHQDGKYSDATLLIEKAIKRNPNIAAFHCNLANAYTQLGQVDAAIKKYHKAIKLEPKFHQAYFNLHALLLNHNKEGDVDNFALALECLQKASSFAPDNMIFRFYLGVLFDYSGKPDIATSHFEMIEKADVLIQAMLDAWRYIKNFSDRIPTICGYSLQTFELCMAEATNDGVVLEFGVRHGNSIRQIARLSEQAVHGFDSFEGIPEDWHQEPRGSYSTNGQLPSVPENVSLHVGWFDDSLPKFLNEFKEPVRFMNIDCDIYSSTRTILELLADRVAVGTVIVFDEYIGYEHWRKDEFRAFQEAAIKYGWRYEYLCFSFMTKQVGVRITAI